MRTKTLRFRVTEQEEEAMRHDAEAQGMTFSAWTRYCLLENTPHTREAVATEPPKAVATSEGQSQVVATEDSPAFKKRVAVLKNQLPTSTAMRMARAEFGL